MLEQREAPIDFLAVAETGKIAMAAGRLVMTGGEGHALGARTGPPVDPSM